MQDVPSQCPRCAQPNVYPDGASFICADCGHEWPIAAQTTASAEADDDAVVVKDANGTPLSSGDSVVLIKDLKLKGSSTTIKQGTKVSNIRIVDGDHEIDCRVDGMSLMLKAKFVRRA